MPLPSHQGVKATPDFPYLTHIVLNKNQCHVLVPLSMRAAKAFRLVLQLDCNFTVIINEVTS